ncbi:MAG: type II toxin-antitoxin system RelE/ParE family toxin [Patescibacteria group bacterium]|nr:type II toxin-antitoxin system RelE/ParE family toxin [Patescibacteria group bacterium]
MSGKDVLKFRVKFYSQDGEDSPVATYLIGLFSSNKKLGIKAFDKIKNLPAYFYSKRNIKHFRHGDFKCFELRVRLGNNICRLFFVIDGEKFIIFHGFTKKTQKTNNKDIEQGRKNLTDYSNNKIAIAIDSLYQN